MTLIPFGEKIKEGLELSKKVEEFAFELKRKLPKVNDLNKAESQRIKVARAFLISESKLCRQIVFAVSKNCLDLALIGLRTMLEFDINADYIFNHPNHKNDLKWVDSLCNDIFKRTNDLGMLKSKLGGFSLKDRAKDVGCSEFYKKNYASLSSYVHLMLEQSYVQEDGEFEKLSLAVVSQALCILLDVIGSIAKFHNLQIDGKLLKEIISYRNRYESK